MTKRIWLTVGVLTVFVVVVFILISNKQVERQIVDTKSQKGTDAPKAEESVAGVDGEDLAVKDDVRKITIEGRAFAFSPSSITLKKGEKVQLTFVNSGGMHDFVIDELDVNSGVIQGGKSVVIEFTAPQVAGTFEYYCSVANHKQLGMSELLLVC